MNPSEARQSFRRRICALSPTCKQRYDSIADGFDDAWQNAPGAPPSIEEHLPEDEPLRSVLLVALIMTDVECRLKAEEPVDVESYFRRFPELGRDLEARAELTRWLDELSSSGRAGSWAAPPGFSRCKEVGRGSMGVVYGAWEDNLNRPVALKFLFPGLVADATPHQRQRKEAEIVASLNHPNVVEIYRFAEHEGQRYCVFEFCAGGSLDGRLRSGPLKADAATRLVAAIAAGVQAAHDVGVIHRDLKPANILFGADGTPKVADFGLARRLDDPTITGGDMVGTLSYAAPEQLSKDRRELTPAADVYSLGAILYHCLAGRPPFIAATTVQTYVLTMRGDPVPASRLAVVARDLDSICLKSLARDPRHRYASAADLADDLGRYLDRRPIRARPPSPGTRLRLWCRRNPVLAVASGLVAAALLTIAALATTFGESQRRTAVALRAALTETRRQETLSRYDYGRQLCEKGDVGRGLLVLAHALETAPAGPEDANLRDVLRIELAGWHNRCHTLRQAFAHTSGVLTLAVSPDGQAVVTGCADGTIRCWDLVSGKRRWELNGHREGTRSVAFGPRADLCLTGGGDFTATVRDAATGEPTGYLAGHLGPISAVAISPDGRLALTGSEDRCARLWDLESLGCVRVIPHDGDVQTVGFSPDGQYFFTGGGSKDLGELRLYDTPVGEERAPVLRMGFDQRIRSVAMSCSEGLTLVIGDDKWRTTFLDVATRKKIATTGDTNGRVRSVAISRDGRVALVGAEDSSMARLYDLAALRELRNRLENEGVVPPGPGPTGTLPPPLPHPQPVTAVSFVPGRESTFLTACEDGYVRVWRTAPGASIKILEHHPWKPSHKDREYVVRATAIDPAGRLAATAGDDGRVLLWDVPSGRRVGPALDGSSPVVSVALTSDGRSVVTGAKDGMVRVWDCQTGKERGVPIKLEDGVSGLSISRDGELVLVGGSGLAQLWSLRTRKAIAGPFRHGGTELSIATAISPDKRRFLTVAEDGTGKLWDEDGELLWQLDHPKQEIRGASFSDDGFRVITASDDGTARVWDATSGKLLMSLTHESEVFSAAFATNERVVTSARDGAQVWDLPLGRRVGPTCKYRDDVLYAACGSGGETAVLADWRGYGVLWSMPRPIPGDPKSITLWLRAEVGMELDEEGGLRVLSGPVWNDVREQGEGLRRRFTDVP